MATSYPVPPTHVQPIGEDPTTGKPYFEPIWLQWFLSIARVLGNSGAGGTSGTIDHETLGGLLGGAASDHYHFTSAERSTTLNGPSAVVVLPAVGASPWTYTNATGFRVFAVVAGGTISDVSVSRDNATFYSLGTSRGAVLGTLDYLKVTYTVAPTVALLPF